MPYNATKFYSDELSETIKQIVQLLEENKKCVFLVEQFESFDELIEKVSKSDSLGDLIQISSDSGSDIIVDEWSPKRLEGLHACMVEKSLRVRYKAPTMADLYSAASSEKMAIAEYMKNFKEGIKFGE